MPLSPHWALCPRPSLPLYYPDRSVSAVMHREGHAGGRMSMHLDIAHTLQAASFPPEFQAFRATAAGFGRTFLCKRLKQEAGNLKELKQCLQNLFLRENREILYVNSADDFLHVPLVLLFSFLEKSFCHKGWVRVE